MARKIVRKPAKKTTKTTPKKIVKKTSTTKNGSSKGSVDLTQFLLPGVVAFLIVWFLSNSITMGGVIFLAVLIGNWFGQTYKNRK